MIGQAQIPCKYAVAPKRMLEITRCPRAKRADISNSARLFIDRKKRVGAKISCSVAVTNLIPGRPSPSQLVGARFSGRLSTIGAAHSGHSESIGIPLTIYPHFSHRSADSSGTAG